MRILFFLEVWEVPQKNKIFIRTKHTIYWGNL